MRSAPAIPRIPALLVLVGLLAVAWPGSAGAQMGHMDQVGEYLDRTGELIMWAGDLVAETESGPARRVLQSATDLHMRSHRAYQGDRPVMAMEISRRARTAVYHAVRLARQSMGLEERIRMRADRFGDEHRVLTERAREAGHERALDLLERARRKADQAREQYHQGDFQLAWKMLDQAGDLDRRAARMLADAGGPERLDSEIERTGELIARVEERLGTDAGPPTLDLLDQAREALRRAREARDQGRPGQALQHAGLARQLAFRAEGAAGLGPDEEDVARQIERFDERYGRLADAVRDGGPEQARDFLDRARENRDRAAGDLAAGDTEQALRRIRAAHDLLHQAEDAMRR